MIRKLIISTFIAASLAVTAAVFAPSQAAYAAKNSQVPAKTTDTSKTQAYTYTAREGDSYSVLARKAIQTYGIRDKVRLTQAQIVAAETYLTQDAGSPYLEVGQSVGFSAETVKAAAKKAQALSANDLAAWQSYVPYVNFDTKANG